MENTPLTDQIRAIATPEDMEAVSARIQALPGQMTPDAQTALLEKLKEVTAQSKAAQQEVVSTLRLHGVDYPLTDWLTPKNYAARFGLKNAETVLNWIVRGIIPKENVKEIPELGLRLVKAIEYSPRAYKTGPPKETE